MFAGLNGFEGFDEMGRAEGGDFFAVDFGGAFGGEEAEDGGEDDEAFVAALDLDVFGLGGLDDFVGEGIAEVGFFGFGGEGPGGAGVADFLVGGFDEGGEAGGEFLDLLEIAFDGGPFELLHGGGECASSFPGDAGGPLDFGESLLKCHVHTPIRL